MHENGTSAYNIEYIYKPEIQKVKYLTKTVNRYA